jgi:hypothetical protein
MIAVTEVDKGQNRIWWLALVCLCAVLVAPLLVVDVPPLLDYPNHLARAFVLASLPADPVLARFYAPHWSIIPNLALDMLAPPLMQILPVHVVGRLTIALAVLLPVLGTIAYNTAVGGRWWAFGVGLLAYHYCLLLGFLNFSISLGVALLLAAGWLRWREDRPRRAIALAIAGAPVLFACHLMGLVGFGLTIGGAELFRVVQNPRSILRRGLALAAVFAAPAMLYVLSALQPLGRDAEYLPIGEKLAQFATIFTNYAWTLDIATAAIAIGIPALGILCRWGRVPGPAAYAACLLAIAFLAAPFAWKGTYLLDTRFAVMLGFMLFAGFVPRRVPPVATGAVALIFAARIVLLTVVWADHGTDLADLRHALQPVQPGQAVYVAQAGQQERPAYWAANPHWRALSDGTRTDEHWAALTLIERRAYWPFQFDMPSQQPIVTREPYRALAGKVGHVPTWAEAAVADVCGFDWVLLLEADALPDLPAARFQVAVRSGFVTLYRIEACAG